MVRSMLSARGGDSDSARRDLLDVLSTTATMQSPRFQGEVALNAAHVFEMIDDRTAATEQLRHALATSGTLPVTPAETRATSPCVNG